MFLILCSLSVYLFRPYMFLSREEDVEESTALASQSVQRFLPEAARDQPLLHASYWRS